MGFGSHESKYKKSDINCFCTLENASRFTGNVRCLFFIFVSVFSVCSQTPPTKPSQATPYQDQSWQPETQLKPKPKPKRPIKPKPKRPSKPKPKKPKKPTEGTELRKRKKLRKRVPGTELKRERMVENQKFKA